MLIYVCFKRLMDVGLFFVLGSMSNIDVGTADSVAVADTCGNRTQVRKVIAGVVGAASSVTSIQVANLLRLFKIPQASVNLILYSNNMLCILNLLFIIQYLILDYQK